MLVHAAPLQSIRPALNKNEKCEILGGLRLSSFLHYKYSLFNTLLSPGGARGGGGQVARITTIV